MIHTINPIVPIQKKVIGTNVDEIYFQMQEVQYDVSGIGLQVADILKRQNLNTQSHILCSNEHAPFMRECFSKKQMDVVLLECNQKADIVVSMIEDQVCLDMKKEHEVDENAFLILCGMCASSLKKHDICVMEYNETCIQEDVMRNALKSLSLKHPIMIMDLHAKYFDVLKTTPISVLLLDETQYLAYFEKSEKVALSEMIENIKTILMDRSDLIIYTVSYHDFIIFTKDEVIRVVCSTNKHQAIVYKEAILSAIVKCYEEYGSLYELGKTCISFSVGLSLKGTCDTSQFDEQIHVYPI